MLCCLVCIALCCAVLCCIASPHCCWSPRNLPNKRQTLQQTSFLQTLPLPALRPYMSPFPRLILYSHLVKPFGAEPLTFFFLLYLFASLPANSFPSGHLTGAQADAERRGACWASPRRLVVFCFHVTFAACKSIHRHSPHGGPSIVSYCVSPSLNHKPED